MERKSLKGGRVLEAGYDEADQCLEIVFSDLSVKRFKSVPFEVWKRLLAAPNAGTFYEDRIQDEYAGHAAAKLNARPTTPANTGNPDDARARLAALFGDPDKT